MSSCPALNCSAALAFPPELKPNPDVSGIGVLIGFLATAYFAWILLVVHYVLVFDPSNAGLKADGDSEDSADVADYPTNPIDESLLKFISKWFERPQDTWKEALEKELLLIMSDQQIITGIALLGSGFSQLSCGIWAYHWQITIYLVWFSSFTHLATFTFLRRYLYENVPLRSWRLGLMTILIASLVIALIPTGNQAWLTDTDYAGIPAWCLFNYSNSDPADPSDNPGGLGGPMELSIIVLVFSYATRAIKMFRWSSIQSRLYLRTKPGNVITKHLDKLYTGSQNTRTKKWIFLIPYYIILSILLVVRSWLDLFESMMFEITWLLIALIWGTLRLFGTRNTTMGNGNILEENFWAFGQALATAMLGLLVFSAIETYIETRRKMKRGASSNDPPPSDNASIKSPECPVHGTGALKPTPNNNSNAALQSSGISEARQIIPMDRDIADESTVASLTQDPQQAIPRSWTAYSTEERTTGEENIQLNATTRKNPRSSLVVESTAPHKANYYEESWYIVLAMFQYLQVLSVSGGILTGAYNSNLNDTNFSSLFGSDNNVLLIFLHLTNWITVWAPLSSLIMTLPYTIPAKKPAVFRNWLLSPRQIRAWAITKQVIIFGIAEFLSVDTLIGQPLSPTLAMGFGGLLLPVFVLVGVILVYAPWYINILSKLRRESRASRVAPGPGPGR